MKKEKFNEWAYSKVNSKIKENEYFNDDIIVVYDDEIHESIAGIVAGKIKDHYYKPTLVFLMQKRRVLRGSARSIERLWYNFKQRFSNLFEKD